MALSKKQSRIIHVACTEFRWTISPKPTYLTLIVEWANGNGQRIETVIDSDIDRFWVEFPLVNQLNLNTVMPKTVETIIIRALEFGWEPTKKGSVLKFKLDENQLKKV